jgi:hypothetical protein
VTGESTRKKPTKPLRRSRTAERIPPVHSRKSPKPRDIRPTWTDTILVPSATQQVPHHPWQLNHPFRRHTSPTPSSISSLDSPLTSNVDWYPGNIPSPLPWASTTTTTSPCSNISWPLSSPTEAHLFRFWMDRASESLDIVSPHSIFRSVVPKLALSNSMLMNAIFLISAQHIQRFDPTFPIRAYNYHERILQCLIPYLGEKGRIEDEATLVAAMLLRTFEDFHGEFKSPFSPT